MNKVIEFLVSKDCAWRSSEASSAGASLVTSMPWRTHYGITMAITRYLTVKGTKFPPCSASLMGIISQSCPSIEKGKSENWSGFVLTSLFFHPFHCLQGGYWHRSSWKELKSGIDLTSSVFIKVCIDYLEKRSKLNHSLTSPVRELSESVAFQFLPIVNKATVYHYSLN